MKPKRRSLQPPTLRAQPWRVQPHRLAQHKIPCQNHHKLLRLSQDTASKKVDTEKLNKKCYQTLISERLRTLTRTSKHEAVNHALTPFHIKQHSS